MTHEWMKLTAEELRALAAEDALVPAAVGGPLPSKKRGLC